ncbi:Unknown protein sequence [Pseudomonas coronafaciens pv. oryzae]|nr:Unknown protein sequence [Pseudomonas coronafaciens pv. oryzae]
MPEALGNRALLDLGTHDRWDQFVYQPVAHALYLQYRCGLNG